jgi:hypothetical protein
LTNLKAPCALVVADSGISVVLAVGLVGGAAPVGGSELPSPQAITITAAVPNAMSVGLGRKFFIVISPWV